jgi:hypothetical protein
MKKFAVALALAAVCGMVTARVVRQQVPGFQPYTVTYQVKEYTRDGDKIVDKLVGTETRWQSHSGAYHYTKETDDGEREEIFGDPARGVFTLKRGTLYEFGPRYAPQERGMADWRKGSSYVRDDKVLGVPVVVLRTERAKAADGTPDPWSEEWLAPSLGGALLRFEVHAPGQTMVREAVSIERGEATRPIPPVPEMTPDTRLRELRRKGAQ